MRLTLLPLFPLQVVVFPRTPLPLHIFEERYKAMVGEAIAAKSEFGIVLARGEGIVNAGCTVVVENVINQYPDGRMDILTMGRRRFEINELNEEKAYLRGEVEFFDDDEPGPAPVEVRKKVLQRYRGLRELGELRQSADPVLTDPQLSFQLAQSIEDLDFLSMLLRNRSEVDRLNQIAEFLMEYIPKVRETKRMKELAPRNGHGMAPSGM